MNTETGQILDRNAMSAREFDLAFKEAEAKGETIVPVSETVVKTQRAGQIVLSRAQRRAKRRGSNNRKKRA